MLLDHLNYCNLIIKCIKFEIGEDDKINYDDINFVSLYFIFFFIPPDRYQINDIDITEQKASPDIQSTIIVQYPKRKLPNVGMTPP